MKQSHCVTSKRLAAPCAECGKCADPVVHIVTRPYSGNSANDIKLYCERCCPEHGTPLLDAA